MFCLVRVTARVRERRYEYMSIEEGRDGGKWKKKNWKRLCERTLSSKIFTRSCHELKARNRGEKPAIKNLTHKTASNMS